MLAEMTRSLLLVMGLAACGKEPGKAAQIIDLSTSVEDLQTRFDADHGEIRFVMLLSPT